MFVGRRPDTSVPGVVVIQSGEEGRFPPRVAASQFCGLGMTFVADLQLHLSRVYRRPVPACPLHDHSLVCETTADGVEWVCPDAEWRCAVGDYEEQAWPPEGLSDGGLAAAVSRR